MSATGFSEFAFSDGDIEHGVFRTGGGPGVVIMHELPGMTEACTDFAREVAREFTVFLPLMFGKPGDYAPLRSLARLCIGREFKLFAHRGGSPIADWLRALCRKVHAECGGPGVGVIGMCLSGNFALSLMADPSVLAPVASQPSLPLGLSRGSREALAVTPAEMSAAIARAQSGITLLGLRFSDDRLCPRERFASLRQALGPAFVAIEVDSSKGNRWGIRPNAHSILTDDFVDESGHPTREARDAVLAFLRQKLTGSPTV
ncbi:MAG TPA: dienelactone hydrolase family protein [Casimicrobiaceae bacterium]